MGGKSARAHTNDWTALHHFGETLVKLGALSENPVAPVGRVIVGWTERQNHTPTEVEKLLAASIADERSKGRYTPFFVICCFCGVRPEAEAPYLTGENLTIARTMKDSELRVTRQKITSAKQRAIPLNLPAWRWLKYCRDRKWIKLKTPPGKFPVKLPIPKRKTYERIRRAAGLLDTWSNDVMRHT